MATIAIKGNITPASAREFRRDLDRATGDLVVEINSAGGSTAGGMDQYLGIKDYGRGKVTALVHHSGSAATLAMVACSEVVMASEKAEIYIHLPTIHVQETTELGDDDLREALTNLQATTGIVAGLYSEKSGKDVAWWKEMLRLGVTWSARGAVNVGLADRVIESDRVPLPRVSNASGTAPKPAVADNLAKAIGVAFRAGIETGVRVAAAKNAKQNGRSGWHRANGSPFGE